MSVSPWRCEQHVAHLQLDPLRATLDAAHPARGLTLAGQPVKGDLLGLEIPRQGPDDVQTLVDCYAHGPDLVTTSTESQGRLRIDAVWRAIRPARGDRFLAGVELIVSARTDLLDSRPAVVVENALAATELLRLGGSESSEPLAATLAPVRGPLLLAPADGPGCVLWRLAESDLSYIEMIHPADFHHDELQWAVQAASPTGGERIRLCHRLFPESLEKGVILRAGARYLLRLARTTWRLRPPLMPHSPRPSRRWTRIDGQRGLSLSGRC